jgi:peroxiredoxin
MYMTYPNASATAMTTQIITDHTGSAGLSKGLNNKFIYQKVPSVATHICEHSVYQ